MAKAQPFMTVELAVSKQYLQYAAECLTDILFDEFDSEVFDVLDFSGKAFREELMTFKPFLEAVKEAVVRGGMEVLERPYDYMNFHDVYNTKEWKSLFNACAVVQEVINEAYNETDSETACDAAIETLKRAGFRIVKA